MIHGRTPHALALALASLLSIPLSAQERAPVSAPVSDVRYEVTFDSSSAAAHTLRIAMSFDVAGTDDVLLSLPAWTPGAYELTWFARWVSNFSASMGDSALAWDKMDYDSWRVRPRGRGRVTVRFDYLADSLDNAMAWSRENFALFNGTNVFLWPQGRSLGFASTVTIHTEPGWLVATGMTPGDTAHEYEAANFHDLVDMPFFVGRFDLDSATIEGKTVRLATWPAADFTGAARERLWEDHRRMLSPMIRVFGSAPYDTYTTMIIFDSTSFGGSALEHQNSHVGIYTPLLAGSVLLPSITAHEIFHLWNVKRLRPDDLVPYQYDRAQPTTWLWVSEGITDYYADLALVRGGIVDSATFLRLTQGKIEEVAETPVVALEDASLSTWVQPADGTGYVYYSKGSLAGLLLDILIRDASENARSLDNVMRALYESTYGRGRGFTAENWWAAVSKAAGGRSFADFASRYIDGREPLPYQRVLPLAGFRLAVDTLRVPLVGVSTKIDSAGARVVNVVPGSSAATAGIREGDLLLRVGNVDASDPQFGNRLRALYANSVESDLEVLVRRGSADLTLRMPLRFARQVNRALEFDPDASAKAVRIRQGILAGSTGM